MKEIDNRQWRQEYPGMPDSFHQALCREVERQMRKSGKKIVDVHRASGRKSLCGAAMRGAVAAALVTLGGMTVFAGAKLRLPELFGWQFTAKQEEQLIQTEPEVSQPETVHISGGMKENMELVEAWPALPDSSPLLDIRETLFDGVKLYVYGIPTENGSNYELNADRLYVNETEVGPVSTGHLYPGDVLENTAVEEEMYVFQVDLSKLELPDPFEVTLPLSVYEKSELGGAAISSDEADSYTAPVRYQNQDLTFSVNGSQTVMACPDQSFDCDEFTLEIREMTVSPTTIRATFYYHMTEELLAACQSSEKLMLPPAIFSESGVECAYAGSYESMEEDGKVLTVEYSNHGISEEDDTCTLVTKLRDYASGEEYEIAAESTVKLR